MTDNLQAYNFLIKPLRDADARDGLLFLKRYMGGPQERWDATRARIEELYKLWSVLECPDELLVYLKRIVGWTPDLDNITGRLTPDLLRRLIAVSAQLWKRRGPEDTMIDVLRVLTGMRARIWNWFEFRQIIDETGIGQEWQGRDPWLVDLPSEGDSEHRLNLRIVDQGTLDRQLVYDVVRLMRAAGERIEVSFLLFLDLFDVVRDYYQWTQEVGTSMAVDGGTMRLTDTGSAEIVRINVTGAATWMSCVAAARLRTTAATAGKVGVVVHWQDVFNFSLFALDFASNQAELLVVASGTPTLNLTVDLWATFGVLLEAGVYYGLRVAGVANGAGTLYQCYLDGLKVLQGGIGYQAPGPAGLWHDLGKDLECSEVEVMPVPMDTTEIGIQ